MFIQRRFFSLQSCSTLSQSLPRNSPLYQWIAIRHDHPFAFHSYHYHPLIPRYHRERMMDPLSAVPYASLFSFSMLISLINGCKNPCIYVPVFFLFQFTWAHGRLRNHGTFRRSIQAIWLDTFLIVSSRCSKIWPKTMKFHEIDCFNETQFSFRLYEDVIWRTVNVAIHLNFLSLWSAFFAFPMTSLLFPRTFSIYGMVLSTTATQAFWILIVFVFSGITSLVLLTIIFICRMVFRAIQAFRTFVR